MGEAFARLWAPLCHSAGVNGVLLLCMAEQRRCAPCGATHARIGVPTAPRAPFAPPNLSVRPPSPRLPPRRHETARTPLPFSATSFCPASRTIAPNRRNLLQRVPGEYSSSRRGYRVQLLRAWRNCIACNYFAPVAIVIAPRAVTHHACLPAWKLLREISSANLQLS